MQAIQNFMFPKPVHTNVMMPIGDLREALAPVQEADVPLNLRDVRVNDDMTLQVGDTSLPVQQHAMNAIAKKLGYPTKNFRTSLPADRIAGDMNILLDQEDVDVPTLTRIQNGNVYAFYPMNRRPHIPPTIAETLKISDQFIDRMKKEVGPDLEVTGHFRNGKLWLSLLSHTENQAFSDDPSYAGLTFAFESRDKGGVRSGLHLMRTSCTNSSLLEVDGGWSYAGDERGQSSQLYQSSFRRSADSIPLLKKTYGDLKETRIQTEEDFQPWEQMVQKWLGRQSTTVLNKWYEEDTNGARFYDAKLAAKNGRDNLYALFNDITYFGKHDRIGQEYAEKAQHCAGNLFGQYFHRRLTLRDKEMVKVK